MMARTSRVRMPSTVIDKLADPKRAHRTFVAVLENIYEKCDLRKTIRPSSYRSNSLRLPS